MSASPPPPAVPDSSALLREVVDNTPIALLALDTEGVIRFAAGAALTVSPEQLVGLALAEISESQEQIRNVEGALSGQPVEAVAFWGGRHWKASYRPIRQQGSVTGVACVFNDITAQVVAETARAAGEKHLRTVLDTANEAIVVVSADGHLTWTNSEAVRLFDRPLEPGTPMLELFDPEAAALIAERFRTRTSGASDRYEVWLTRETGEVTWLLVSASPMLGENGELLGSVAVLTDITQHKAEKHRLEVVALTDPMTGAANRITLTDRVQHALHRRAEGLVAVLFLDVDNLKTTNDTLGHAAGDDVLRYVVTRTAAVLRPEDTIARYGGDEFVLVCEELHDLAETVALAERVRVAIAAPFLLRGREFATSVSIGVATAPPLSDLDELVAAADAAAYAAKRAGRNAVQLAD